MLNVNSVFFVICLSFVFSVFFTYVTKRLFYKLSIIDIPNKRSSHDEPTVLSGGIAFLGVFFSIVIFLYPSVLIKNYLIVFSLFLLLVVSFYDDIKNISVRFRFFVHFLVGNVFYFSNLKLNVINFPFYEMYLNDFMSYVCTIFFVISIINIYNFMDGIDGYATGIGVFVSLFFSFSFFIAQFFTISMICLILAMILLGFLVFNFPNPKAKIFMGDVGSSVLGALFALLSLKYNMLSFKEMHSILIPIMVMGVFVCDASCTIFLRLLNGENIFKPHRSHFYQKLNIMGWRHRKILWLEYSHAIGCIVCAICIFYFNFFSFFTFLFLLSFLIKFLFIHFSYNRFLKK